MNEKLAEKLFDAVAEAAGRNRRWCDLTEAQRQRATARMDVRAGDVFAEIAPPPLPERPGGPPVGP